MDNGQEETALPPFPGMLENLVTASYLVIVVTYRIFDNRLQVKGARYGPVPYMSEGIWRRGPLDRQAVSSYQTPSGEQPVMDNCSSSYSSLGFPENLNEPCSHLWIHM